MNNSLLGDIVSPAAATCAHRLRTRVSVRPLSPRASSAQRVARGAASDARLLRAGRAARRGAEGGGAAPPDAIVLLGACSGASGGLGDESEPLTKRHIDGIFTDSYSRYRKQMAVKKYLAAVLGKRYKQRVKNKGRRVAYL